MTRSEINRWVAKQILDISDALPEKADDSECVLLYTELTKSLILTLDRWAWEDKESKKEE